MVATERKQTGMIIGSTLLSAARGQFDGAIERANIALNALDAVIGCNGNWEPMLPQVNRMVRECWHYYQRLERASTTNEDAYEQVINHADRLEHQILRRVDAIPELARFIESIQD